MKNNAELIEALKQIVKEKGIDEDIIFEALETSLVTACKKDFGANYNVKVVVNRETGEFSCFIQKNVVEVVEDDSTEISLEDARLISPSYEIEDVVDIESTPKDFGRIAAQTAKQVVLQKLREAEREIVYNEYVTREKEVITGVVQRREGKNIIVAFGKTEAVLTPNEQVITEEYTPNERIKVYVNEVKQTTKGPFISVSRAHPELVKKLFLQEVPEIYDGVVEIKSISREAGARTKIAVYSNNPDVDAVGACVGQNGHRVNAIVNELGGEKIDIIDYSEIVEDFIAAALSPSKVIDVLLEPEEKVATVIVPDYQLSLAIGKEGQNVRLAARLTGHKIDIKTETVAVEMGILEPYEPYEEEYYEEGIYDGDYESAEDYDREVYEEE